MDTSPTLNMSSSDYQLVLLQELLDRIEEHLREEGLMELNEFYELSHRVLTL